MELLKEPVGFIPDAVEIIMDIYLEQFANVEFQDNNNQQGLASQIGEDVKRTVSFFEACRLQEDLKDLPEYKRALKVLKFNYLRAVDWFIEKIQNNLNDKNWIVSPDGEQAINDFVAYVQQFEDAEHQFRAALLSLVQNPEYKHDGAGKILPMLYSLRQNSIFKKLSISDALEKLGFQRKVLPVSFNTETSGDASIFLANIDPSMGFKSLSSYFRIRRNLLSVEDNDIHSLLTSISGLIGQLRTENEELTHKNMDIIEWIKKNVGREEQSFAELDPAIIKTLLTSNNVSATILESETNPDKKESYLSLMRSILLGNTINVMSGIRDIELISCHIPELGPIAELDPIVESLSTFITHLSSQTFDINQINETIEFFLSGNKINDVINAVKTKAVAKGLSKEQLLSQITAALGKIPRILEALKTQLTRFKSLYDIISTSDQSFCQFTRMCSEFIPSLISYTRNNVQISLLMKKYSQLLMYSEPNKEIMELKERVPSSFRDSVASFNSEHSFIKSFVEMICALDRVEQETDAMLKHFDSGSTIYQIEHSEILPNIQELTDIESDFLPTQSVFDDFRTKLQALIPTNNTSLTQEGLIEILEQQDVIMKISRVFDTFNFVGYDCLSLVPPEPNKINFLVEHIIKILLNLEKFEDFEPILETDTNFSPNERKTITDLLKTGSNPEDKSDILIAYFQELLLPPREELITQAQKELEFLRTLKKDDIQRWLENFSFIPNRPIRDIVKDYLSGHMQRADGSITTIDGLFKWYGQLSQSELVMSSILDVSSDQTIDVVKIPSETWRALQVFSGTNNGLISENYGQVRINLFKFLQSVQKKCKDYLEACSSSTNFRSEQLDQIKETTLTEIINKINQDYQLSIPLLSKNDLRGMTYDNVYAYIKEQVFKQVYTLLSQQVSLEGLGTGDILDVYVNKILTGYNPQPALNQSLREYLLSADSKTEDRASKITTLTELLSFCAKNTNASGQIRSSFKLPFISHLRMLAGTLPLVDNLEQPFSLEPQLIERLPYGQIIYRFIEDNSLRFTKDQIKNLLSNLSIICFNNTRIGQALSIIKMPNTVELKDMTAIMSLFQVPEQAKQVVEIFKHYSLLTSLKKYIDLSSDNNGENSSGSRLSKRTLTMLGKRLDRKQKTIEEKFKLLSDRPGLSQNEVQEILGEIKADVVSATKMPLEARLVKLAAQLLRKDISSNSLIMQKFRNISATYLGTKTIEIIDKTIDTIIKECGSLTEKSTDTFIQKMLFILDNGIGGDSDTQLLLKRIHIFKALKPALLCRVASDGGSADYESAINHVAVVIDKRIQLKNILGLRSKKNNFLSRFILKIKKEDRTNKYIEWLRKIKNYEEFYRIIKSKYFSPKDMLEMVYLVEARTITDADPSGLIALQKNIIANGLKDSQDEKFFQNIYDFWRQLYPSELQPRIVDDDRGAPIVEKQLPSGSVTLPSRSASPLMARCRSRHVNCRQLICDDAHKEQSFVKIKDTLEECLQSYSGDNTSVLPESRDIVQTRNSYPNGFVLCLRFDNDPTTYNLSVDELCKLIKPERDDSSITNNNIYTSIYTLLDSADYAGLISEQDRDMIKKVLSLQLSEQTRNLIVPSQTRHSSIQH